MTSVVEYYRNSIRTGAYHEMRYNLLKCAVHLLEMCAIIDATGFLTQTQTDDVIHIFDLPLSIAIPTKRMKKKQLSIPCFVQVQKRIEHNSLP